MQEGKLSSEQVELDVPEGQSQGKFWKAAVHGLSSLEHWGLIWGLGIIGGPGRETVSTCTVYVKRGES